MKFSRFNSFISLSGGKTLGYNAFARRFIVFPEEQCEIVDACKEQNSQQLQDSTIIEKLVEGGFVISDDFDELQVLDDEIRALDFDCSSYEVTINPTMDCNFHCWYCYEDHERGSRMTADVLERTIKHFNQRLKAPLKKFALSFFGGEPLLYFDTVCKPIIQHCGKLCKEHGIEFRIHFTSNGYLVTSETVEFLKDYFCSFQITLDGSKEYHDKVRFPEANVGSYERILEHIKLLSDAEIAITLRINYTLKNLESIQTVIDDLIGMELLHPDFVHVNFQRVWQDGANGGNDFIKEQILMYSRNLKSKGFRYSRPDLINARIESCYGSKLNYFCINYNGDVYKCTARKFNRENRIGSLDESGNITWDKARKERWEKSKFSKAVCRSCRIAPLCLGGCRQRNIERTSQDECPLDYDETKKDDIILLRFETQYLMK